MSDLSPTITPKSDQLNADDLITGPRTIKVTKATVNQGAEQPASIFFEGDNGKPYKPGLSMRRVLVRAWGIHVSAYVGRRMTLYRDDTVKFGGVAVGGIRISHMSDIDESITLPLSENRKTRKPFTVRPLPAERAPSGGKPTGEDTRTKLLRIAREKAALGAADLGDWLGKLKPDHRAVVDEIEADLRDIAAEAGDCPPPDDDGFPGFAPADEEVA
ncbi:hypothetical protein OKC48_21745 [Methylorubrum extorquens]|uniref:hypothetical protein n=1 Tax=Methylorubrum extorquens TaxID=408 RepID=UPI002238C288|nr:hypothetical protein [Methylorubrum extorquens]UYW25866.1 hypothetical protein OKC48_21745 [Methylorubrum extorquens]